VTGWHGEERTLPRDVAERCRGGKEKVGTLAELI